MIGEGIVRRLANSNFKIHEIQISEKKVGFYLKVEDDYVRLVGTIATDNLNTQLLINNPSQIFKKEYNEIVLSLAEYIIFKNEKKQVIELENYISKEYEIHSELAISDEWLFEQANIGLNLILFEKYLKKTNTNQ